MTLTFHSWYMLNIFYFFKMINIEEIVFLFTF